MNISGRSLMVVLSFRIRLFIFPAGGGQSVNLTGIDIRVA